MPLGDEQDKKRDSDTAVLGFKIDFLIEEVRLVKTQLGLLAPLPGEVARLRADWERQQSKQEQVSVPANPMMVLMMLLVIFGAAAVFGVIYLGGQVGQ